MRLPPPIVLVALVLVIGCTIGRPRAPEVDETYLNGIEHEVLAELNLARTNPAGFAEYVAEWIPYYEFKHRTLPGQETIWTTEGVRGVEQAIEYLDSVVPVGALKPLEGLTLAARDHAEDMGPGGGVGHMGMDDSEVSDRVSRYGKWHGKIGEVIAYGAVGARGIVIQLIIDDGVPSRAHRQTIFDPEFVFTGIAVREHAQFGTICVVTFAENYIEDG